jgi:molybdopterin synthase sulfur carrier subunit
MATHSPSPAPRKLTLKFFAGARDAVGQASLVAEVGPGVRTIRDLVAWLCERHPALAHQADRLLTARNLKYTPPDTPVEDGDEIALFPPVSGG